MDRQQKTDLVNTLHNTFEDSASVVIVHCVGLTVAESTDLRNKMRNENCNFKVTKNRISKLAIKGTKYENMSELFAGPTAIAFSDDPVAAPKIASSFAKENEKFSIIGGGLDGVLMSVPEIEQLASLPSLDQLRGKIIGLLNAPAQNILSVNIAVASKLTRVFKARAEQQL